MLTGNVSESPAVVRFCDCFASFLSRRSCLAFFGGGLDGSRPTPVLTQQQNAMQSCFAAAMTNVQ